MAIVPGAVGLFVVVSAWWCYYYLVTVLVSLDKEIENCMPRLGTESKTLMTRALAIDCARLSSLRAAATVHEEMKRGLASLVAITNIAPFVGIFGSVIGIVNSFKGESN